MQAETRASSAPGSIGGMRDDPVILLGMHHSGTSIFAEVLHRHGVFMQADMAHHESKFFTRQVNERLVMGGGDAWARDPIMPVAEVMAKVPAVREEVERRLRKKYIRAGYDGVSPWGFKDPRACVTLPLLLELFPNARLLHIVRQEADVAESLATSNKAGVGLLPDRERWRSLQRQHVARAREYGQRHHFYHEFSYEDFCRHPIEVTRPIFEKLDLPFTTALEAFLRERIYTHRIDIATPDPPQS